MKRTAISILILTLAASSLVASTPTQKPAAMTNACVVSLEHINGAWRMKITCDQGSGTIALLDLAGAKVFKGDGVFSKWSQRDLNATYDSLLAKDEAAMEYLQLG
ncbi:MAG TPA: hypothetical protein VF980_14555 [Thermoanaerobaculia bacterium]